MSLFKRPTRDPVHPRVRERASHLGDMELLDWAETCLFNIGSSLTQYRRMADPEHLEETRLAADTLWWIVEELRARSAR